MKVPMRLCVGRQERKNYYMKIPIHQAPVCCWSVEAGELRHENPHPSSAYVQIGRTESYWKITTRKSPAIKRLCANRQNHNREIRHESHQPSSACVQIGRIIIEKYEMKVPVHQVPVCKSAES